MDNDTKETLEMLFAVGTLVGAGVFSVYCICKQWQKQLALVTRYNAAIRRIQQADERNEELDAELGIEYERLLELRERHEQNKQEFKALQDEPANTLSGNAKDKQLVVYKTSHKKSVTLFASSDDPSVENIEMAAEQLLVDQQTLQNEIEAHCKQTAKKGRT